MIAPVGATPGTVDGAVYMVLSIKAQCLYNFYFFNLPKYESGRTVITARQQLSLKTMNNRKTHTENLMGAFRQ